jgi:pimeloyl-ACP methyl ester carboxylesterase
MSVRCPAGGNAGGGFRLRRLLLPAILAFGLALAVVFWSWIDAQARALVVLSSVLEPPVLAPAVEGVTREPRLRDNSSVAGYPALVARPAGEGQWPALLLANGTIPQGRKLPEVRRLAEGFARAGYLVAVPDLPGLRTDTISPQTRDATVEAARAVSAGPDARGGEVGLVGVSTGATLAVLAAEAPALKDRVSVVAGVAPYSNIKTVLNLATTGHYERGGEMVRYDAEPFLSYVAARSLISTLPPGEDRSTLLSRLERVERYAPGPLAGFREDSPEDLGPDGRSVLALLRNRDPERFEALYEALPVGTRQDLEALSPLAGEGRVEAPVALVSGPRDIYFPVSESRSLARIAPDHRVTVTGALDHAELSFSIRDLRSFARMDAFVVRSLRQARQL